MGGVRSSRIDHDLSVCIFFLVLTHGTEWGILVTPPGIEPVSPVLEERKVLTTGPPESPFDLSVLFLTPETGQGNQTGFNFLRTLESFLIKSSGKASPFSMCPQWTAFISQLPRSPGLSGCSGMTLSVCFLQRLTQKQKRRRWALR